MQHEVIAAQRLRYVYFIISFRDNTSRLGDWSSAGQASKLIMQNAQAERIGLPSFSTWIVLNIATTFKIKSIPLSSSMNEHGLG